MFQLYLSSRRLRRGLLFALSVILLVSLAACGGTGAPPTATPAPLPTVEKGGEAEKHQEETGEMHQQDGEEAGHHHEELEGHTPEEHIASEHNLPEEALSLENPIPATEESIEKGRQLYAQNCAVCHGDQGFGDGPSAVALDPKPANLHEDHVQGLPDGALFWIISHGVPETAMPPWENVLSEEERWHIVNFLRTFKGE